MRAYPHPNVPKPLFIAALQAHSAADQIVQGQYESDKAGEEFRGCAVGCSIHTIIKLTGECLKHYDHKAYEKFLGVPHVLAHLEDKIFEGLPAGLAREWPLRFSNAIQPGADLTQVWSRFAAWMMRELVLPTVKQEYEEVRGVIVRVAHGYETAWSDDSPKLAYVASAAAASASAAASAAAAASASAAAAGWAEAAAAGWAAGWAAEAAAGWAEEQAFIRMADKFEELLIAAPVSELETV